jgi:hypothetical protein
MLRRKADSVCAANMHIRESHLMRNLDDLDEVANTNPENHYAYLWHPMQVQATTK